ncbi:hypothetical protein [Streptomyces chartreusis]|uniref:MFS transporter n=1 Tax=Streptomyces chartreusis TaxID=1969 RepID=A0A7I0Y907_STRCX|nr:hypothetical protein [Streptomyces chartreusis]QKZ15988.1 hypothetical protein HUT05_00345 [Streptomyces chartreusis]
MELFLHGFFCTATDGVLMALTGLMLPEHLRTMGIALFQTGQALAYLASSVLFGLAWQLVGPGHRQPMRRRHRRRTVVATAFLLINRSTTPIDTELTASAGSQRSRPRRLIRLRHAPAAPVPAHGTGRHHGGDRPRARRNRRGALGNPASSSITTWDPSAAAVIPLSRMPY